MSYILDSIKKSDKERIDNKLDAPAHLKIPPYLDAPATKKELPSSVIVLMGGVIALLLVALIAVLLSNNNEPVPQVVETLPPVEESTDLQKPIELEKPTDRQQPTDRQKTTVEQAPETDAAVIYEPAVAATNEPQDAAVDSLYETREQQTQVQAPELVVIPDEIIATSDIVEPLSEPIVAIESIVEPVSESIEASIASIPSVFSLDATTQRTIPDIKYDAHIYASDNNSGFVILNGAKKQVGDSLRSGLYIEKINQEDVVLSFNGLLFTLPALKSWSYQ